MKAAASLLPPITESGGYVYVLGFDTGVVKIGSTTNPRARVVAQEGQAEALGVEVTGRWISPGHQDYRQNETSLLARVRETGGVLRRQEYFTGVGFDVVVEHGKRLPFEVPATFPPPLRLTHANPEIDAAALIKQRNACQFSRETLARLVGISDPYLAQIERGDRRTISPALYVRIGDALGLEGRSKLRLTLNPSVA